MNTVMLAIAAALLLPPAAEPLALALAQGPPQQLMRRPPLAAPAIPTLDWVPRSDWLDVKKGCGASGDGTTDDTVALTVCMARISNNGGAPPNNPSPGLPSTLYFPPGTYVLSQTLTLNQTQGKALIGHGATSVLLWKGAADGIMLRSDGAPRRSTWA